MHIHNITVLETIYLLYRYVWMNYSEINFLIRGSVFFCSFFESTLNTYKLL